MSDGLFGRYEHLVKRPHEERAKELLLKTASLVKPIMRKHGWKVGLLAEFLPTNDSLWGMNYNRGAKILLRLRPNHAPDTFLDLEQIVGTMLHELTHNVFGPHDAKFYELLGKLEGEYDELWRKGFTGEGFMSDGSRLGGSHGVPQHIGRIKGFEAAEKRAQKQRLMGPGGKLGGANAVRPNKTPRELAAEAAERRLRDDKRCEHGDSQAIELEAAKAAQESEGQDVRDIIVIDDESEGEADTSNQGSTSKTEPTKDRDRVIVKPSNTSPIASTAQSKPKANEQMSNGSPAGARNTPGDSWSCPRCTVFNGPILEKCSVCDAKRPGGSSTPIATQKTASPAMPPVNPDGTWNCQSCTFINRPELLGCEVCGTQRPRDESKGWYCDFCYQFGNEHAYWMCRNCGAIKRRG